MTPQEFVACAEAALAKTPTHSYLAERDRQIGLARTEFDDDIAQEVNDALADYPVPYLGDGYEAREVTQQAGLTR